MLELYIIRHGQAGKPLPNEAEDELRPLTKKGKKEMKDIAKGLKGQKISFDVILTSPLARAKESADIVNDYCGNGKKPTLTDYLKPNASFNTLTKFLNQIKKAETVAIVGHEPFLSAFASYCLTKDADSFINLKKGGILVLEVDKAIKPGKCTLTCLLEPKQIIQ